MTPQTPLTAHVSVFHGSTNTTPVETVPLADVLQRIQDGTYQQYTEGLRGFLASGDSAGYRRGKEQSVAFTPCCALYTRAKKVPWDQKLISTTGLVYFDLDHLEDPEDVKARLAQNPHVVFAFVSPSGAGLKIGIAASGITGPADYKQAWRDVLDHLTQTYPGVHLNEDKHVKYLNALCYVSYDPFLYVNAIAVPLLPPSSSSPQPSSFLPPSSSSPQPSRTTDTPDYARVASALAYIPNNDADYDTWLTVGMALHSSGESWGRDCWDGWSRQSSKFDDRKQDASWASFTADGKTQLGSLFHLAKQQGWRPPRATLHVNGARAQTRAVPDMTGQGSALAEGGNAGESQQLATRLKLKLTKGGDPRPVIYNVLEVLSHDPHWQGVWGYDEFAQGAMLLKRPPYLPHTGSWTPRPIEDHDDTETTYWLQAQYDLYAGTALVAEGIQTLARRNPYHPIRQYLAGLQWDGTPRLDTWLTTYCHADKTAYTSAVGAKSLISAVARVEDPGCKADCVPILEGDQGSFKSTVWRYLASDAWFTDTLPDLHEKDAAQSLRGKWIVELGELAVLQRSEIEAIKRFISANQDHYRPSYGRRAVTFPRHNIFVGSTNKSEYFKDETGNRRFWPVALTGFCDVDALQRDRDKLWAEAFARYRKDEAWHLTPALEEQATKEQAARVEVDDWEEPILEFLELHTPDKITTRRILQECFHFENPALWTQTHTKRIGAILRRNGWRHGPLRDKEGKTVKGYVRKVDKVAVTSATGYSNTTGYTDNASKNNVVTCVTGVTSTFEHSQNISVEDIEPIKPIETIEPTASTESTGFTGYTGYRAGKSSNAVANPCNQSPAEPVTERTPPVTALEHDCPRCGELTPHLPKDGQLVCVWCGALPLAVGDWCLLYTADGALWNTVPYLCTAIEQGSDGLWYARFLEVPGGWLVTRCAKAPDPAQPSPQDREVFDV